MRPSPVPSHFPPVPQDVRLIRWSERWSQAAAIYFAVLALLVVWSALRTAAAAERTADASERTAALLAAPFVRLPPPVPVPDPKEE